MPIEPASLLPQVLPAGQRHAGHRRKVRRERRPACRLMSEHFAMPEPDARTHIHEGASPGRRADRLRSAASARGRTSSSPSTRSRRAHPDAAALQVLSGVMNGGAGGRARPRRRWRAGRAAGQGARRTRSSRSRRAWAFQQQHDPGLVQISADADARISRSTRRADAMLQGARRRRRRTRRPRRKSSASTASLHAGLENSLSNARVRSRPAR